MHSRIPYDLKRRVLCPLVLAAAVGAMPAAAIAQSKEVDQFKGTNQSGGQSQTMNKSMDQAAGMEQAGDEITLTQQEASEWEMRPVVNQSGEKVGQVSSITLGEQGKIEQVEVELEQTMGLGGETVTLQPSQFSANKEHVKLDMSTEEIKDLPKSQ